MSMWHSKKLKDYPVQIIDGDRGVNYPQKSDFKDNGFCVFLNTGNVTLSGFDFSEVAFITEEKHKTLRKGHLKRGDIVLTTRGTIGNVAYYHDAIPYENIRINSGMIVFRADPEQLHASYFHCLLRSPVFRQQAELFMYGAAQQQLPISTLKHISLPLPPLNIQGKISKIISAYDDLIDNNITRIKALEEEAKITFDEWFVRMRFPEHKQHENNSLGGIPDGWNYGRLGELTILLKRGISPQYVSENGNTVINQKCIRDHRVDLKSARKTSTTKAIPLEKQLRPYDILVNSTGTGTLGRVAQWFRDDVAQITVDSHVTIVRASDRHSALYLGRVVERNEALIESLGRGATNQKELASSDLASMEVLIPPRELQRKFHSRCEPIFKAVTNLSRQNSLLKEARDLILPALVTGRIDVAQYDPAKILAEAA